ncbi:hypothetical protein [Sphingomonas morindae]|uniref:Uncharacterized protein n=1 Tax=Sphingomonas morindae TaxID=1541170 RepID=A0ABY4XAE9_9SPHN|nr:hypothetical protein [Sphingomonas morindae]USI73930.1 hypothetical protein LHA26_05545 [Sphingomonas morindae]
MEIAEGMTRLERARIVRDAVVEQGRLTGKWGSVELGNGQMARPWIVDGEGWTAFVSTPFTGLPGGLPGPHHGGASSPGTGGDLLIDVFHPDVGKVLSIASKGDQDRLIGMQAGPWEALFGLPYQAWSTAKARSLAAKAAARRLEVAQASRRSSTAPEAA